MDIPRNDYKCDNLLKVQDTLVEQLAERSYVTITHGFPLTEVEARAVGQRFKEKGYFVRLQWNSYNGREFFYGMHVSKKPIDNNTSLHSWGELL